MTQSESTRGNKTLEALARFAFGGVVTAITGYVAMRKGPVVGGLFLAFPAILPASLTLVKKHEGRRLAGEDAAGARYGSVGMIAFGVTVWWMPERVHVALVLLAAAASWLVVGTLVWLPTRERRAPAASRHD